MTAFGMRFCTDCAYHERRVVEDSFGGVHLINLCRRRATLEPDPVDGCQHWAGETLKCEDARGRRNACGPRARWFRAKPTPKILQALQRLLKGMKR